MKKFIDLVPQKTKSISPVAYNRLSEKERSNIESCRFIPPKLGSNSFGRFVLTLKRPVYSFEHGESE